MLIYDPHRMRFQIQKMDAINTIPNKRPSHEATDKKWHNLSNKWSNAECATCWLTLNLSRWYQRWNGYVQVYEYLIQLSNECFVPPLFLSGKEGRFIKLISFFFKGNKTSWNFRFFHAFKNHNGLEIVRIFSKWIC